MAGTILGPTAAQDNTVRGNSNLGRDNSVFLIYSKAAVAVYDLKYLERDKRWTVDFQRGRVRTDIAPGWLTTQGTSPTVTPEAPDRKFENGATYRITKDGRVFFSVGVGMFNAAQYINALGGSSAYDIDDPFDFSGQVIDNNWSFWGTYGMTYSVGNCPDPIGFVTVLAVRGSRTGGEDKQSIATDLVTELDISGALSPGIIYDPDGARSSGIYALDSVFNTSTFTRDNELSNVDVQDHVWVLKDSAVTLSGISTPNAATGSTVAFSINRSKFFPYGHGSVADGNNSAVRGDGFTPVFIAYRVPVTLNVYKDPDNPSSKTTTIQTYAGTRLKDLKGLDRPADTELRKFIGWTVLYYPNDPEESAEIKLVGEDDRVPVSVRPCNFVAVWERVGCSVVFKVGAEQVVSTHTVAVNSTVNAPSAAAVAGKIGNSCKKVTGWTDGDGNSYGPNFTGLKVTKDTEFTATLDTITYVWKCWSRPRSTDSGAVSVDIPLSCGGEVTPSDNQTIKSWTWKGHRPSTWSVSPGGIPCWTFGGGKDKVTNVNQARTLYLNWSDVSYLIYILYDSTGTRIVSSLPARWDAWVTVPKPEARTGYTFSGWDVFGNLDSDARYRESGTSGSGIPLPQESGGPRRLTVSSNIEVRGLAVEATAAANPTTGVSFSPVWQAMSYQIRLHYDKGPGTDVVRTVTVTYNGTYAGLSDPSPAAGYAFAGWFTGRNGTGTRVYPTSTVKDSVPADLYAYWKRRFTLTFDWRDGTSQPESVTATEGESVAAKAPQVPNPAGKRVGYTFDGWYTEAAGGEPAAGRTVSRDETYYAHWIEHSYVLKIFPGGNGTLASGTDSVIHDVKFTDVVTVKGAVASSGYGFVGWTVAGSGFAPDRGTAEWSTGDGTYKAVPATGLVSTAGTALFRGLSPWNAGGTAVVTLTARYLQTYTLRFDAGPGAFPGTGGVSSRTVTDVYAKVLTTDDVPDPEWTGHTFAGWVRRDTGAVLSPVRVVGNVTLDAVWKLNLWELGYDNAFLFTDWCDNARSCRVQTASSGTLGLGYETGTVTLLANSGDAVYTGYRDSASERERNLDYYRCPVPSGGFVLSFRAWGTEGANASVTVFQHGNDGACITHSTGVIYSLPPGTSDQSPAVFTKEFAIASSDVTSLQVRFNLPAGGANRTVTFGNVVIRGTGFPVASRDVPIGTFGKIYDVGAKTYGPLETPVSGSGARFVGWYDSAEQDLAGADSPISPTGKPDGVSRTVYSRWSQGDDVKVAVNLNGGSGSTVPGLAALARGSAHTYGDLFPSEDPSREGYEFSGWSLGSAAGSTLLDPNSAVVYTQSNTLTLYAQWAASGTSVVTVSFSANVPSGVSVSGTVGSVSGAVGASTVLGGKFTRSDGYRQTGWASSSGASSYEWPVGGTYVFSSGVTTLYAVWEQVRHTVTFASSGGTVSVSSVQVAHGTGFGNVTATRTGYQFDGWADPSGTVWTGSDPVVSDLVLTAKWTNLNGNRVSVGYDNLFLFAEWAKEPLSCRVVATGSGAESATVPSSEASVSVDWSAGSFTLWRSSASRNAVLYTGFGNRDIAASGSHYNIPVSGSAPYVFRATLSAGSDTNGVSEVSGISVVLLFYDSNNGYISEPSSALLFSGTVSTTSPRTVTKEFVTPDRARFAQFRVGLATPGSEVTVSDIRVNPREDPAIAEPGYGKLYDLSGATPQYGLESPSRVGFRFGGWYRKLGDPSAEVSPSASVSCESFTAWSAWIPKTYHLAVELGAGGEMSPELPSVPKFDDVLVATVPVRPGYDFSGWTLSGHLSGTAEYSADGDTWTAVPAGGAIPLTGEARFRRLGADDSELTWQTVTLTAGWTAQTISVKFDGNGASSGSVPDPITVTVGGTYGDRLPLDGISLARGGFTFGGWATDRQGANPVTPSSAVTAATTLFAVWTPKDYKITFTHLGGPRDIGSTVVSAPYLSTFSNFPAVTAVPGVVFLGWRQTFPAPARDLGEASLKVLGNHTVDAVWGTTDCSVTFDPNGGELDAAPSTVTVHYGLTYGDAVPGQDQVRYGERMFVGWFTDPSGGSQVTADTVVSVTQDHTLYAHWAIPGYRIEFVDRNTGATLRPPMTVDYGAPYAKIDPFPARVGFTFVGWSVSGVDLLTARYYVGAIAPRTFSGGESDILTGEPVWVRNLCTDGGPVKFRPIWFSDTYTVIFDAGQDSSGRYVPVTPGSMKFTNGDVYSDLPSPSRDDGYRFDGWWMQDGGTERRVSNGETVFLTGDVTFVARWASYAIETKTYSVNPGGSYDVTTERKEPHFSVWTHVTDTNWRWSRTVWFRNASVSQVNSIYAKVMQEFTNKMEGSWAAGVMDGSAKDPRKFAKWSDLSFAYGSDYSEPADPIDLDTEDAGSGGSSGLASEVPSGLLHQLESKYTGRTELGTVSIFDVNMRSDSMTAKRRAGYAYPDLETLTSAGTTVSWLKNMLHAGTNSVSVSKSLFTDTMNGSLNWDARIPSDYSVQPSLSLNEYGLFDGNFTVAARWDTEAAGQRGMLNVLFHAWYHSEDSISMTAGSGGVSTTIVTRCYASLAGRGRPLMLAFLHGDYTNATNSAQTIDRLQGSHFYAGSHVTYHPITQVWNMTLATGWYIWIGGTGVDG